MINNIVEKSKPLVWAKFNNYTSNELKILEVYLSRINAREPESSSVMFTKKEYCELMGIHPNTKTQQLKKYTGKFIGNYVTLNIDGGYEQYPLFTKVTCQKDPELGEVTIKLTCNPDLKQIFFQLAEDGYIRYKLKNIISLNSRYSVRLYSLLKDKAYGNYEWVVDVEELRKLLDINAPRYDSFKYLNAEILKKCEEEINSNTDIRFSYEKIQRGRTTRAVKFFITEIEENEIPGQIDMFNYATSLPEADEPEHSELKDKFHISIPKEIPEREIAVMELYAESCEFEFNWNEMQVIVNAIPSDVQFRANKVNIDDPQLSKADYLADKYAILNTKKTKTTRYKHFLGIVKNDWV